MPETYGHLLPSDFIKHVSAICGANGVRWIKRLPELISELEDEWCLEAGPPFEKGEYNFVASAALLDGREAVLKIAPPYDPVEINAEAEFLKLRDGDGCVKLWAEDRNRFALLIEKALPGVTMDTHFAGDPFACVEPAIEVLRSIISLPRNNTTYAHSLDDWFARFSRFRDTEFPHDYGERALSIYQNLRKQNDFIKYLHGDFHPGNIVAAQRSPFLAIDPKGVIGHLAYDIAVFLNNLHRWQKGKTGVADELHTALRKFAVAFGIEETGLREATYSFTVIGAWWNFEDMPEHYNNEVVLADVWDI